MNDPLSLFDPVIRSWFAREVGQPTEVQGLAWPAIAAGDHVLVTAPTGSGKTLAAFLWGIDQLLSGRWELGGVRILYLSPLRALGNDIRRNLLGPLAELDESLELDGRPPSGIRVMARTGDTSQTDRRRMMKNPPEILITTPESLNILLTSNNGRRLLTGIRTVILDEVHAVVASKRGVHLMSGVERLTQLSGEFQRVALSATVNPHDRVARWVGGYRIEDSPGGAIHHPRPVKVVVAKTTKSYELDVALPLAEPGASRDPESLWNELTVQLKRSVRLNRSTLIFGNSKRTVEKVARFLNEDEPTQLAYSHHGALSREIRAVVEERLKAGTLKAIVATNSLELGIDIGSIDEVAMVQPPATVASATQRLGRSGHGVGETSRGRLYPLHPHALLESAVLVRSVLDGDLEPSRPVTNALDVLAQIVVSMTVKHRWRLDDLFDAVRACDAYRHLSRIHFDLVLQMLAGRYASTRLRPLRPLVAIDGVNDTVIARPGVERLLYLSGGTIPDRGYFNLRIEGSGAPLGQLDEEFVWERSVGDTFTLGVQTWRVQAITHNDVFVSPATGRSAMAPFWRAEERDRSSFLSDRVGRFLEHSIDRLEGRDFTEELISRHHLQPDAAAELRRLLVKQTAATGTLPHRHQVVVEHTVAREGRSGSRQMVIHTVWGGRVNRPFGYALAAAWADAVGHQPDLVHGDDCLVITYPVDDAPEDVFELVAPHRIEDLLRRTLEDTGFFGARFREAAGRSLLLPRGGGRRRTPLWLNRQRAKELLEAISGQGDFPLVLEAWRECLHDEFELEVLRERLEEIADGRIVVHHVHTDAPSPFAEQVTWRQTNRLMYEDDRPPGGGDGRLSSDLVREMVFASHLRPNIRPRIVNELQSKLHRVTAGYSPRSAGDLVEWVKDRLVIPSGEWLDLLAAMERDHQIDLAGELAQAGERIVAWSNDRDGGPTMITAVELLPRVVLALGFDLDEIEVDSLIQEGDQPAAALDALAAVRAKTVPESPEFDLIRFLGEWLAYYGPVPVDRIASTLGVGFPAVREAVDQLVTEQSMILDRITDGAPDFEVCDRENLERLLRMNRAASRPAFEPLPLDLLPLFLAHEHGLGSRHATIDDLKISLEGLFGWSMPVDLLETELLPARVDPYLPSWLDTLMAETDLGWFGTGERRIALALEGDRQLIQSTSPDPNHELADLFPRSLGRYTFDDLLRESQMESSQLLNRLWRGAWQGVLVTDTFVPVRHGVTAGFELQSVAASSSRRPRRRPRFDRWRSERPLTGAWRLLEQEDDQGDALDREEDNRERVRILLDRYGVVFRELIARELSGLRWSDLFRSLRMLELAGEVVAGRFFDGVPGLQFISKSGLRLLEEGLPEDRVWWVNAADPAAPCGLGPMMADLAPPRRIPSNHLVFHGRRMVIISEQRGARLDIRVPPDHPRLADYLEFLRVQLGRSVQPRSSITVEQINGEPAPASPYRPCLEQICHVTRTPMALRLSRGS